MKDLWLPWLEMASKKVKERGDERREDCSKLRKSTSFFFVTFPLPFWTNEIRNIEMKSKQMGLMILSMIMIK